MRVRFLFLEVPGNPSLFPLGSAAQPISLAVAAPQPTSFSDPFLTGATPRCWTPSIQPFAMMVLSTFWLQFGN